MSTDLREARDLFLHAVGKLSPEQWEGYIADTCGVDSDLAQQVRVLLRVHREAGSFLDAPAPGLDVTLNQPLLERTGSQIGPYKLLQQIGEGGMGTVYMAEQTEPVQRKVALKVIKPGMDSGQVIARFEAERQALAMMDHVNIARVYDAGATEAGRPYFVMELVHGVPITKYCDDNRLTPRQRLELFVPVCQAIQHAHQKGIIHRDIKPSNVMVTLYDGKPVPKVIDFGVAKATEQKLTERTLFTQYGTMVGTLEYMSPEQAEMSALGIDTRSDIFSLGVLLYELLTGTTPLTHARVREAAYAEVLRIIKEEEAPKPSTRLTDSGEALASISAQRHTEPAKLSKLMRGELDWIVMKTLEKDRNRRYETAKDFAADVQRYLDDETVLACPPSAWYRFRKFARRNQAALVMASILAGALAIAVVALSVSNLLVARERDQKTQALSDKVQALANESAALTKAKEQEGLANERAEEAKKQQTIAKEQELLARRRFYAAQTNLAQQAWEAGQPARTLELLESQRPKLDQEDLRGFDWYYLWRLCHRNLHRTLSGPKGEVVYTLAITPDGKTLVTGSTDANVRVWDMATGKERAVLTGHQSPIWRLAVSPDGKIVASASWDQTVKLWDLGTSELQATLAAGAAVRSAAFSPDGTILAAGTAAGALELWDVGARKRRLTVPAHSKSIIALAYAPDGKMLVTGAGWGTSPDTKVWDMTSEPPRIVFQSPGGSTYAAFSPDSKLLATGTFVGARVFSVPSGELKATFQSRASVTSVAFSADGNTLVLGGGDRTVNLWEFATGATRIVGVHLSAVNAVAFFPQFDLLASGSSDGSVKVWHASPPQDTATFALNSAIRSLAFTPDSKLLVVGSDTTTTVLDATTGKVATSLPVGGVVAVSADANLLAASAPDDKRVIWDVAAARARAVLPVEPNFAGATFSRDGRTLLTWRIGAFGSDWAERTGRLWDLDTSRLRVTLKSKLLDFGRIRCAAFSPDGRTLATGHNFGEVTTWDPTTGQQRMTLLRYPGATIDAVAVAFSNDSKMLAAGTSEGMLRLWNVETGQLKVSFKGPTEAINSVAFSPDDKTLLSGSKDKTARLWDVATGQELLKLQEHSSPVTLVAFAPDSKRLATASGATVKLCLAATEPEATAFRMELDPDDADSARATNNWGDRLHEIHRPVEAGNAYRKALARLEKLAAALPDTADYRQELAYSLFAAEVSLSTDQAPTPEQSHRHVREVYQKLPPDQQRTLALRYDSLSRQFAAGPDSTLRDPSRAVEFAKEAVELCANDATIWNTLGVARYRAGDWKGAALALNKSLEVRNAGDFGTWFYLSMACWKLGAKDEARKWYTAALVWTEKRAPKHEGLLRLRGEAAALLGLSEKAADLAPQALTDELELWTLSLDAVPKTAWAYRSRAQIHMSRGNYDKAILDFVEVTDLEPLDPQAWYDRGLAQYRLQKFADAVADFTNCLKLKVDQVDALHFRGHSQGGMRRWKESVADHSKAIELAPKNLKLRICRGHAYAELDEWQKAAEDLAVGQKLQSADKQVWFEYALLRLHLGEKESYQKSCAQLLERYLKTTTLDSTNLLAWTCVLAPEAVADMAEVVALAEKLAANDPENAFCARTLGAAFLRTDKLEAAIEELTRADGLRKLPTTWLLLAVAHRRLGKTDEARQWLDKAVLWMDRAQKAAPDAAVSWDRIPWSDRLLLGLLRREAEME